MIRSEVVQRWAAAGWLLKCAKTPTGAAGVKLALFYDWLFFTNGAEQRDPRLGAGRKVEWIVRTDKLRRDQD